MDEPAKTEARNYLSAAGFFLIAGWFLLGILTRLDATTSNGLNDTLNFALGIGLLVIATLLIVLRKRDMIAILFFMMGFWQLFCAFTPHGGIWDNMLIGFMVLVALITLTSKEKIKWLLFLILAILFVRTVIINCIGYTTALFVVFTAIIAVLCLYYAFCCASERISLPGRKLFTADESTDFKASGSVLGYMLFAILSSVYIIHYIFGESVISMESGEIFGLLVGLLMVYVSILLISIGNMRFTPIMFLLIAILSILTSYCSGMMFVGIAILWVVIGLFCILRKESRILPGLMLIIYGCADFLYVYEITISSDVQALSVILNLVPCLVAIYLSFVVYSQRKLPKF